MTPEILSQVEALAGSPSAAEALCGKLNVEFHPLGCSVVRNAAEGGDRCNHVSHAVRLASDAAYAKQNGAKPTLSAKPVPLIAPKFTAAAAAPGVSSPFDAPIAAPVSVSVVVEAEAVDEPAAEAEEVPVADVPVKAEAKPAKAAKKK